MDRSTMDRTANVSWTDILSGLHQSVRKAVLDAGHEAIGTRNAKGERPGTAMRPAVYGFQFPGVSIQTTGPVERTEYY